MPIRSVADLTLEGKRVFLRVDFNVPLTPARGVADDARIRASLPTVKLLLDRGARLVVASHLGRPKGAPDAALSLEPVGARLADLLARDVILTDEPVGDGARKVVSDLRDGQVALLENLRFHPGEEANDEGFARALASYADVYVNDAFGTAHRAHASTVGMLRYVGEKGAGLLMLKEIELLARLLGPVDQPYVAVLGGAKVSEKIAVLEALAARVDKILVGGAMANTFLRAQGQRVGRSRVEEDRLALARSFLKRCGERGVPVLLPRDVIAAPGPDATTGRPTALADLADDDVALDIGPETVRGFADELAMARTIFWNGPMGVFERPAFAAGTAGVARAIAANGRALSIVGGGDTVAAVELAGAGPGITHLSTGGGAALELLEGKTLPGIAALDA